MPVRCERSLTVFCPNAGAELPRGDRLVLAVTDPGIDLRRGPTGEKARRGWLIFRLIARHVQQRSRRGPSGGDHQQIAIDPRAVGQLDAADSIAPQRAHDPFTAPGVGDRSHVDAYTAQVERGQITISLAVKTTARVPGRTA